LRGKIRYVPIGFELLPDKFPLSQLQHLYETILQGKFEKRNFRKKILSLNILSELAETQQGVPHRAARLYSFDPQKYEQLLESGFDFNLDLERKRKSS
jgi:8-oxo-dGTP diphosphatase